RSAASTSVCMSDETACSVLKRKSGSSGVPAKARSSSVGGAPFVTENPPFVPNNADPFKASERKEGGVPKFRDPAGEEKRLLELDDRAELVVARRIERVAAQRRSELIVRQQVDAIRDGLLVGQVQHLALDPGLDRPEHLEVGLQSEVQLVPIRQSGRP